MKKREMITLTNEENKPYKNEKVYYICKKEFSSDDDIKKNHKVRDHGHYKGKSGGDADSVCNVRYKTPKEIPVVFQNGFTYAYHFIIKELAK